MPSEQITIAGTAFNVPLRYEEGHELTAGEASALNQTFHENIRNNLAGKIKKHETVDQAYVDEYANSYQFGIRTAGAGVSRDPVQSEAMRIARKQIGDMIRKSGKKVSDYETEALNGAAKALLEKDPAIMDLARQRVAEQQSLASADLGDLLSGLTPKAPEAAAPAAPTEAPAQG